jgi:hypothetical protein
MASEEPQEQIEVKAVTHYIYKYHTDPEYRTAMIKYASQHRKQKLESDPEYHKAYMQKMMAKNKERYHNDPEYREKRRAYYRERYQQKKQAVLL